MTATDMSKYILIGTTTAEVPYGDIGGVLSELEAAADRLRNLGASLVIVTGTVVGDSDRDGIIMAGYRAKTQVELEASERMHALADKRRLQEALNIIKSITGKEIKID